MRTFLKILIMISSISAMAISATDHVPCEDEKDIGTTLYEKAKEAKCNADAKKLLRSMCSFVSGQDSDPSAQGRYQFLYQTKLLEASCVDPEKDSDSVIAEKVSKTWKNNEQNLNCTNVQFDVQRGSLIKFAVSNNFNEFIADAIRWKINLNKVDETDGRTVLDYVKDLIEKNNGKKMQATLKMYYQDLRKAGAKHKSEL